MFAGYFFVWTISSLFVVCNTGFVDTIVKCSIHDDVCLKNTIATIFRNFGPDGLPEYGIPSIDPISLSNVEVAVAGQMDITLIEGKATGIKSCMSQKFSVDLEKGQLVHGIICDVLIVGGKYKVSTSSELIRQLLGGKDVHGEGNGKVEIAKINLTIHCPLSLEKRDGDIYMKFDSDHYNYDYEVMGKVVFNADNLYLGEIEDSKNIIKLMNDNWQIIIKSFGRLFIDKAMEYYFNYVTSFLKAVPSKYYFVEDLSSYVKS